MYDTDQSYLLQSYNQNQPLFANLTSRQLNKSAILSINTNNNISNNNNNNNIENNNNIKQTYRTIDNLNRTLNNTNTNNNNNSKIDNTTKTKKIVNPNINHKDRDNNNHNKIQTKLKTCTRNTCVQPYESPIQEIEDIRVQAQHMSEREYRYKKDGKNRDSKDRNNGRDVSTSKNIKIAAALLIPTVKNINKSTNKSISKSISTDKNIQKVQKPNKNSKDKDKPKDITTTISNKTSLNNNTHTNINNKSKDKNVIAVADNLQSSSIKTTKNKNNPSSQFPPSLPLPLPSSSNCTTTIQKQIQLLSKKITSNNYATYSTNNNTNTNNSNKNNKYKSKYPPQKQQQIYQHDRYRQKYMRTVPQQEYQHQYQHQQQYNGSNTNASYTHVHDDLLYNKTNGNVNGYHHYGNRKLNKYQDQENDRGCNSNSNSYSNRNSNSNSNSNSYSNRNSNRNSNREEIEQELYANTDYIYGKQQGCRREDYNKTAYKQYHRYSGNSNSNRQQQYKNTNNTNNNNNKLKISDIHNDIASPAEYPEYDDLRVICSDVDRYKDGHMDCYNEQETLLVVNVNVNREFDNEKGNEKDNYNESSFNIGNNYANKDNCIGRDDHTVCANYISKHKDTIKNGNGSDVRQFNVDGDFDINVHTNKVTNNNNNLYYLQQQQQLYEYIKKQLNLQPQTHHHQPLKTSPLQTSLHSLELIHKNQQELHHKYTKILTKLTEYQQLIQKLQDIIIRQSQCINGYERDIKYLVGRIEKFSGGNEDVEELGHKREVINTQLVQKYIEINSEEVQLQLQTNKHKIEPISNFLKKISTQITKLIINKNNLYTNTNNNNNNGDKIITCNSKSNLIQQYTGYMNKNSSAIGGDCIIGCCSSNMKNAKSVPNLVMERYGGSQGGDIFGGYQRQNANGDIYGNTNGNGSGGDDDCKGDLYQEKIKDNKDQDYVKKKYEGQRQNKSKSQSQNKQKQIISNSKDKHNRIENKSKNKLKYNEIIYQQYSQELLAMQYDNPKQTPKLNINPPNTNTPTPTQTHTQAQNNSQTYRQLTNLRIKQLQTKNTCLENQLNSSYMKMMIINNQNKELKEIVEGMIVQMNKLGIYGGGGGGSRNGSGNGNGNGGVGYKKEEDNFGMEKNKYKNLSRCNSQQSSFLVQHKDKEKSKDRINDRSMNKQQNITSLKNPIEAYYSNINVLQNIRNQSNRKMY